MLVDLRGAERREQEKTRPCVVVSNNRQNQRQETLVVVPITSLDGRSARIYEVHLSAGEGDLPNDSAALPHQIRTIDRFARVVEIWGVLDEAKVNTIGEAMRLILDPNGV